MKTHISRYTHLFKSSKEEHLIFSSLSRAFMKVSEDVYTQIIKCKQDPSIINKLDDSVKKSLIEKRILVSKFEDSDFLLEHEFKCNIRTFSLSKIGLILVPTTQCNMQCPYCFEPDKKPAYMSDKIVDDLIEFIRSHKKSETLDLTWYGGEPLLAKKTIRNILQRIHNELNIQIKSHRIITNGYLFDEEAIELFKQFPLDSIQITLDGDKERHNKLRCLKNSQTHTYDKILQNINSIVENLPDVDLHIRVNIEKSNLMDFINTKNNFEERWGNKIKVYPGILRIDDSSGKKISCSAYNKSEASELLFDLSKQGIYHTDLFPQNSVYKGCTATHISSHIIGPKGEIYKCWNDVSDENKIVGYINRKTLVNQSLFYRYVTGNNWYNNEECRECFFLPICNGTCAWYQNRNKYEDAEFATCDCMQKSEGMLNKTLEYWYGNNITK